jgi:hypothetical protein
MKRPPDRQKYAPSGRLEAAPFVVLCAITIGVALLGAFVVHLTCTLTFPSAIFGPLLAGMPLAGVVAIAVRVGRCRSPWAGAALGVFAGLFLYFGAFQFGLAAARGNDHFPRVDLLPAYLDNHVRDSDLWEGRPAPFRRRAQPRTEELVFRWSILAAGCVVSLLVPTLVGWSVGGKPFNEEHGRWLKAWPVRVTRRSGEAVAEAVYWRDAERLRESIKPLPPGEKHDPAEGFAHLLIEYLPGEAGAPVYLSVNVVGPGKSPSGLPRWIVSRWELDPDEAAAVADVLPIPNSAFGTRREGTLPGDRVRTAIGAKVIELPDQDAGLVLSSGNLWVATVIGLAPLVLGICGGVAAGLVGTIYYDDLGEVEFGAVVAAGVISVVASLAWMTLYGDYLPARYFLGQARRVIAQRPDPFVHADDPDAFFIQRIPRANWGRVMLENADEVGLMLLDAARGVILYEGDRQRWAIPRESVVGCELEAFDIGPSDPNVGPAFWLVVLRVNVDGRVWEVPLAPRPVTLSKQTPTTRRRDAEALQARVRRVLGT